MKISTALVIMLASVLTIAVCSGIIVLISVENVADTIGDDAGTVKSVIIPEVNCALKRADMRNRAEDGCRSDAGVLKGACVDREFARIDAELNCEGL